MNNIYELEKRELVPNWRDFEKTLQLGELSMFGNQKVILGNQHISNNIIIDDWHNNKTIGHAADLINNLYTINNLDIPEVNEAIDFIEQNKQYASESLLRLIKHIKQEKNPQENNTLSTNSTQNIEELRSITDPNLLNSIIKNTKTTTRNYDRNAITWIELARLYTIKGLFNKAEKCILIALHLAPNNRFVLRSATRFFIHIKDSEKAIYYLKKATNISNDPWLISAHIATSKIINRYSPFINKGKAVISSKKFSNYDLTELASSLGTLELEHGSFKKSKPFIDLSILTPNDNSLAQFEWLSKKESRLSFNSLQFEDVKNPFEAFAFKNYSKANFDSALSNCIDWFLDIPYSKRPLALGSYLATMTGNYEVAVLLCNIGIMIDNREVIFINNLIYNYCLNHDLEKAEILIAKYFKDDLIRNASNEEKITISATLGLFYIRTKRVEEGKSIYKSSIENATKINNQYYYNLAIINLTRELYLIKDIEYDHYYNILNNIETTDVDIIYQLQKVKKLLSNK
ncbi:hypothetical protein HX069_12085 [Myroides odoratimimus]|uniref:tetratricopeptide repeat protein n=1 Tax=Myroides odoratimimus TaxID=76832 RepID=UPI0025761562|nr:hypothetical protein [Myroides odoratimimus]MDM1679888.1 hypothetical protein [Myroides odoratimimus]